MKYRLRFAPSPTGFLHMGSLRTALFTFLIAKHSNGKIILRIENTDQTREIEGATDKLIEILNWAGIKFDEGPHVGGDYGPYIQSQRLNIYKKYVDKLLDLGYGYYCFCTPKRLQRMRENLQAKKLPPRYDMKCRNLSKAEVNKKIKAGEKFVIRQKMPTSGDVIVNDALRGEIKFNAKELDDHVLIKSSGIPTYQFANVIDDHLMKITHVTRAEEWISSFPKNILLYKAFGWTPPIFIHYSVILNKTGGKLSKRQGDVFVENYKDKGYLPEAIINFCSLLGWHPAGNNEILSINDIIKEFDYKNINVSPAVFEDEKLDYFNGYYIRNMNQDDLFNACVPYLIKSRLIEKIDDDTFRICNSGKLVNASYVENVIFIEQERLKKLSEISELSDFFFADVLIYDAEILIWKKMTAEEVKINLKKIREVLELISKHDWNLSEIKNQISFFIKSTNDKVGKFLWPLRVSLTGKKASPGVFEVAVILGKDDTLNRINNAINLIS